jgi:hypothetical protein
VQGATSMLDKREGITLRCLGHYPHNSLRKRPTSATITRMRDGRLDVYSW